MWGNCVNEGSLMKRVLITGARSYVGDYVYSYLLNQPEEYVVSVVDLHDNSWQSSDFSMFDTIFHVAGIAHADLGRETRANKELYFDVNSNLTYEVAKKACAQGVKQFIFMSTANVYGDSSSIGGSKVICRESLVDIVNLNGASKYDAENKLHQLESETFKVAILRAPMIYGKGCKGNYRQLSKMARTFLLFPKIKNQRSMLYIGNLAELVRLIIKNEDKGLFFPCDKGWFCTSDVVQLIAQCHGRKVLFVPGVTWALRFMGLFTKKVNKAFGSFCYEETLGKYKEEYRLYTLEEGIALSEAE